MTIDQQQNIESEQISPPVNPGKALRAGREKRGMSVADAAASLRLPLKTLEHIEAGRFEALPGNTFSRGYVRNYARLLELDANRLVLEFDQFMGVEVREGKVGAIDNLNKPARRGLHLTRFGSLLVVLAMVVSGVLWWHESRLGQTTSELDDLVVQRIEDVKVDASPMPLVIQGDISLPLTLASAVEDESETVSAPAAESSGAETDAVALASTSEPDTAAASSEGLSMQFKGNCWLQITADNGEQLHSALMQSGQSLQLPHKGPMNLVIGAIESVSLIEFQGQPVSIPSSNRSGVVRLRLGQ